MKKYYLTRLFGHGSVVIKAKDDLYAVYLATKLAARDNVQNDILMDENGKTIFDFAGTEQ